jgi:hypothetical protein
MSREGVPLLVIQRQLGHADLAKTLPGHLPSDKRTRSRGRGLRTLQPERIVSATPLTSNPPAALRSYSPMADLGGRGGRAGGDLARA